VEARVSPGFNDIYFIHSCIPELNLDEIDTSTMFLGKRLEAPFIISGITGGHEKSHQINKVIAEVVGELGLGMGVGSQRAAIECPSLEYTYSVVREVAPSALIIANIGASQVVKGYGIKEIMRAIKMVDADAIAIHVNPLQESLQLEGEAQWKGFISKLSDIVSNLEVPVIVKEVGCGISMEDARLLWDLGIRYVDIAGLGGTSWAAVEMYRAEKHGLEDLAAVARTFWDWGIPSAVSLVEVKLAAPELKVIGSGGVRSGIDAAKLLSLGADVVGLALPVLREAAKGRRALKKYLERLIKELKIAMFLIGAANLGELRKKQIIITGKTREWLEIRGVNVKKLCKIDRNMYEVYYHEENT